MRAADLRTGCARSPIWPVLSIRKRKSVVFAFSAGVFLTVGCGSGIASSKPRGSAADSGSPTVTADAGSPLVDASSSPEGGGRSNGDLGVGADQKAPAETPPELGGDGTQADSQAVVVDGIGADQIVPADRQGAVRMICNGESRLTFAFVRRIALSNTEPGSQVVWENGQSFLRIDGQCHYWAFSGDSPLNEVRTGTLSQARAQQIETDLRFSEWPSIAGVFGGGSGFFGVTPDVLSDGTNEVTCLASCSLAGPADMKALFSRVAALLSELAASGQPASGSIRIAIEDRQDSSPSFSFSVVTWPLASSMASFVLPFGIAAEGTSFLISGGDADVLRKVRVSQRTAPAVRSGISWIPVRVGPNERLHAMYLRDTLPFEDSKGLLPRTF